MDIQFQVRQNAMEMQEYMKDLFDWQKSIKKKERALVASMGAADSQSSTTPAPRGRASGAVAPPPADLMQPALGPKGPAEASKPPPAPPKAKQPDPSADDKKNAAAHTYTSYRKWDKFDIDAALASDDDEPGPSSKTQDPNAGGASKAIGIGPRNIDSVAPTSGASPSSATGAVPVAPAPSTHSFTPASSKGISITARDPTTTAPTEDLLKPLATTRISKPAANESGTTAQQDKAPGAPAAAPLPPIRNTQPTTADAWRARGNDLFKAGEYESAHECYSRSIGMQPTCLGHANRAMALLKLRRWQEAVEDCTCAIELDPLYVKAYQRRAAAHRQLGASHEAARDWEQALRLEPENRATAADRDAAVAQLLSERKLQPPSRRTAVPVSWVLPPPPPPPPPSQQEPPQQPQQQGQEQHAPAVGGLDPASPMQRPPPSKKALPASTTGGSLGMGTEAVGGRAVAPVSNSSSSVQLPAAVASSCQPLLPPPQQEAAVATAGASSVTPGGAATGTRGVTSATAATAAATVAVGGGGGASGAVKSVPRTSVEFEAAWRSMAGDLRRQAAYLAAIPPASLPSIFKNSLTAPVLASLVRCLLAAMMPLEAVPATNVSPTSISMTFESRSASGAVSPAQGVALLEGLTRVARFDLMVMSVPSKERQELRAGWEGVLLGLRSPEGNGDGAEGVEASSRAPDADGPQVIKSLQALRQKYRI